MYACSKLIKRCKPQSELTEAIQFGRISKDHPLLLEDCVHSLVVPQQLLLNLTKLLDVDPKSLSFTPTADFLDPLLQRGRVFDE